MSRNVLVRIAQALSGGLALLWWCAASPYQIHVYGPLSCKVFTYAPATYWISMPNDGPIRSAAELYAQLGGASSVVHVKKMFPQTNTRTYDGTCTNGEVAPACATSAFPSPCFCINPGEGVEVRLSATREFSVLGSEPQALIPLSAGGVPETYLISLPFRSALSTAQQLLQDLGPTNVIDVRRMDPATGAVQVYRAQGPGTNFPLTPGEGYQVSVRPGINFAYIPLVYAPFQLASCPTLCDDYALAGTSGGFLFTFQFFDSTSTDRCNSGGFVSFTPDVDAPTMAMELRDMVTGSSTCRANGVTATSPLGTSAPVFRVCLASLGPQTMWVGSPPCQVTAAGCSFNPTATTTQIPPADPGPLRCDKLGTDLILSWNDIGDPDLSWNIYRNGALHASHIVDADAATAGIQWVDPEVPAPGTLFTYVVVAVNGAGESPR